jgi:predicted transcriptional regulator
LIEPGVSPEDIVMSGQERLDAIARDLNRGGVHSSPVSVRTLLSWFDAERRGYWIVRSIRRALKVSGLRTDPDFEAAYLDSLIQLRLVRSAPVESQGTPTIEAHAAQADSAGTAALHPAYEDPTYRISKLEAANKLVVSVTPDALLVAAVTLMMGNDFSQLPVMTNERVVRGVVSWSTIGSRLALGHQSGPVRDFMEPHQEIASSASLFAALSVLVNYQYVLIRGVDQRIVGIVTASDLGVQFQQLAEPFLLLAEIENHLRRILAARFPEDTFKTIIDPLDVTRKVSSVADLTFGEYVRFLESEENWQRSGMPVDRRTFISQLGRVRDIRNDVMHFDPDGIRPHDLDALRDCARFMERLKTLGVT